MRHLIAERGLQDEVEVDSAGTGDWHVGSAPDQRATAAARRRGIELTGTARQVTRRDYEDFDLLLVMDRQNLRDVLAKAPPGLEYKVRLLADGDVPDPYYGEGDGFARVLDIVEVACERLLDDLRQD